jgi:hypothetical protein
MSQRKVRPLPVEVLEALSTERLMAYRAKLMSLEDSAEMSDHDDSELAGLPPGFLYFKQDPGWRDVYRALKSILADREHIE